MASKVQVCNLALTRIAASRITSFSDQTVEAKDCNAIYDLIVEEVISMGPWPSARYRTTLAQTTDTPSFEYTYTYQLPTEPKYLEMISINDSKPGNIDYIIEGDKLLTNEASVGIKYIGVVSDAEKYDIYLRQAIVDRLSAELIYGKTGQLTSYKAALDYAAGHAKELLAKAAMNTSSAEDINSDTFIDVRNGGWPNEGRLRDLD